MGEKNLRAFRSSAAYYETLFDSVSRIEREAPLLESIYHHVRGNSVVDLACGTGPHALYFAELGAQVDAFDLSAEMIAHAAATRPHPSIDYRRGDLRDPQGGPWSLALCLGNSLSLLPSRDEVALSLERLRGHLTPGGCYLIQILNYAGLVQQEPVHRVVRKESDGIHVTAVKSLVPQGNYMLLSLAFYAMQDRVHESVAECALLQALRQEELVSLSEAAGWRVLETYGAFDRSPYDPDSSSDLILLLENR